MKVFCVSFDDSSGGSVLAVVRDDSMETAVERAEVHLLDSGYPKNIRFRHVEMIIEEAAIEMVM